MSDIQVRKAQADDLPMMQRIARRTIDKCYRSFLGDEGVDWFINSGESDRELEKHIENCDVLLSDNAIVACIAQAGLEQCRQLGFVAVVVLGHSEYYPRFGFSPSSRFGIDCEYDVPEEVFMAMELQPDALHGRTGKVQYDAAFSSL